MWISTAKEQIFEIREKNIVLKVVDEDIKVDISKKDITNKKELSGAHLQVKNEDGEVLDSWISTDQEHRICHLEVGKKYILEETMAPYGYEKSEKVEFVILEKYKKSSCMINQLFKQLKQVIVQS